GAAKAQAAGHDLFSCFAAVLLLLGITAVKEDQRVEIAVAGVKDVSDDQPILFADAFNLRQRIWDLGPGDHAILRVMRRGDAAHGAESRLAPQPQKLALLLIAGTADLPRLLLH